MDTIHTIIETAVTVYQWILVTRVLLSWIPLSGSNAIINFIYEITEPVLAPFRKIIPASPGLPIDFSPILAFLALDLLGRFLLMIF